MQRAGRPPIATCKAHSTSDPTRPCLGFKVSGLDVCTKHGGSTRAAKAKATAVVAVREAQRLAQVMAGESPGRWDGLPTRDIIMGHIYESAKLVDFYGAQVGGIPEDHLIRVTRRVEETVSAGFGEGGSGTTTTREVGPDQHMWLQLYNEERDRLIGWCAQAERLKIDTARVEAEIALSQRVAQSHRYAYDQVMRLLVGVLPAGSPLTSEIRDVFIDALRMLTAGQTFPTPGSAR